MPLMTDAVEAALIAGGVSFAGLLITNQSKISEFRQTWINALREDVATVITHALEIHAAKAVAEVNTSFPKIAEATARIQLRLNPKEQESKELILALGSLRQTIHSESTFEQVAAAVEFLTGATQVVLKREWRRVKRGEPFYCWTRRLLIFGLCLLALFGLYHQQQPLWRWFVEH